MKIIGLTGRSGSGKSTLAGALSKLGVMVIDGDEVAAGLLTKGSHLLDDVIALFGGDFLRPDGTLDRSALGKLVFSDAQALGKLNAMVHPAFKSKVETMIGEISEGEEAAEALAIDAAVLFESGLAAACDLVVTVMCDDATMAARISSRDKISLEEASERVKAQKAGKADYELITGSDVVIISRGDPKQMIGWAKRIMRIIGGR